MYCCTPFENMIVDAGNSGISIVLRQSEGLTFFCIQARACDDIEKYISENQGQKKGTQKIRLVTEIGIKFCPFCGCSLMHWLENHPTEAGHLSVLHEAMFRS